MNRPLNLPPSNHDDIFDPPRKKSGLGKGIILLIAMGGMCIICVPITLVLVAIAIPSYVVVDSKDMDDGVVPLAVFEKPVILNKDESTAVSWLRSIVTIQNGHGRGRYISMSELLKERDFGRAMARAPLEKYRLDLVVSRAKDQFWVKGMPKKNAPRGSRYFFANSKGLIYYSKTAVSFSRTTLKPRKKLTLCRDRRQIENERTAVSQLKSIHAAQSIYKETNAKREYGTLEQLAKANFVDEVLGAGTKQGYKYTVVVVGRDRYWVKASPVVPGLVGSYHYFSSHDGLLSRTTEDFEVNEGTCIPRSKMQRIR